MSTKTKLIVLVILIAFVGGFLWYTKTPAPTDVPVDTASSTPTEVVTVEIPVPPLADTTSVDTSNWLTYTNTKYGYSLKYPSNLEPTIGGMWTTQTLDDAPDMLFIDTKGTKTLLDDDTVFGVEVVGIEPMNISAEEYAQEERLWHEENNPALQSVGDAKIYKVGFSNVEKISSVDEVFGVYQYAAISSTNSQEDFSVLYPATYTYTGDGTFILNVKVRNNNPTSVAMLKTLTFQTP